MVKPEVKSAHEVQVQWKCGHSESVWTFAYDDELVVTREWYRKALCDACYVNKKL